MKKDALDARARAAQQLAEVEAVKAELVERGISRKELVRILHIMNTKGGRVRLASHAWARPFSDKRR